MRDWHAYVKEHLGSLRLHRNEAEDIAEELAGHLEEHYAGLLKDGLPEEKAFAKACAQAGNWLELRRGIISAKREGTMRDRVSQIWVPGLVTLVSSWGMLAILIWADVRPVTWHAGEPRGVILYLPWLLVLPLIGAAGGYMSRRALGARWRVYLAGTFPVVAIGTIFLLLFPFAFIVDPQVVPFFKFASLLANIVSWVILPGTALCIGVVLQGPRKNRAE